MVISFKDQTLERLTENRASDDLSPSLVAKRDLERYYKLLEQAEHTLDFTTAEYNLIYDVCNGTLFDPVSSDPGIWMSLQDALVERGVEKKWKVDGDALVKKLRALTQLQSWALVDKIERFWREQ